MFVGEYMRKLYEVWQKRHPQDLDPQNAKTEQLEKKRRVREMLEKKLRLLKLLKPAVAA
jgi:hypothetical protein